MSVVNLAVKKGVPFRQIADFRSPVNPIGPSSKAKHALRKEVRNIWRDVDASEINRLRYCIAGLDGIRKESVIFGHGACHLAGVFLEVMKIERVVTTAPLWPRIHSMTGPRNIIMSSYSPDTAVTFDGDGLLSSLNGAGAAIIPYPHSLTGFAPPPDELCRIIDVAEKDGKYVIIDESLRDYTVLPSVAHRVAVSSNALVVRTLSTFQALKGLRFGYAIAGESVITALAGAFSQSELSGLAYPAVRKSIQDAGHRRRTEQFISEEKGFITAKLKTVEGLAVVDPGANILLIKGFGRERLTAEKLFRWNILVDQYDDESGNPFFPVMIQKHDHNARLVRAIKSFLG